MSVDRFVFDTNVLISSIAFRGSPPDDALRLALDKGALIFSRQTISEFREVILRPKFDRYIERRTRQQFFFEVVTSALIVEPVANSIQCRDSRDQKFLDLIAEGRPSYIVSGDQDLLVLESVADCRVVSPAQFIQTLGT